MIELKHSIRINKSPKAMIGWLSHFTDNYKSWHPDHVSAKWIKGNNFSEGSILYSEEYLGGQLEKLRFKVTKVIKNERIEYDILFPESIICPKGSFSIKPCKKGIIFTATLSFRFGYLLSKLFPRKLKAIKRHMKEEGENLKKLLEGECPKETCEWCEGR
jgi:hypothetical protein